MDTALTILYWAAGITGVVLLLFFIVFGLLLWKARSKLNSLIFGGTDALERKYEQLRDKYPNMTEEETLRTLVDREALTAGMIGFVTGLGGMVTLPVALPLDILATMKIQSRLIAFIREHQGGRMEITPGLELPEGHTENIQNYAILAGAKQLNNLGVKLLLKMIMRYAPKVVLQALPIVGGIVGFLMDWLTTRGIGRLALSPKFTAQPAR